MLSGLQHRAIVSASRWEGLRAGNAKLRLEGGHLKAEKAKQDRELVGVEAPRRESVRANPEEISRGIRPQRISRGT
jgi:hypothetical protein